MSFPNKLNALHLSKKKVKKVRKVRKVGKVKTIVMPSVNIPTSGKWYRYWGISMANVDNIQHADAVLNSVFRSLGTQLN